MVDTVDALAAAEAEEAPAGQRPARFDVLFEPVKIGPVTAKNRFYQPPHCNGMGGLRPEAHAAMRGMKAEGGWAVVNTENCSVHPTSDLMPEVLHTLWDDEDIAPLALMCDAVHAHGALAGVQLAYSAYYNANKLTREIPMGPEARPLDGYYPGQARAMGPADFRNLRRWHRDAAARARRAGFDILNVDANFSTVAFQFLSPRNRRTDEYGGALVNRVRLLRELIESVREGAQGDCAVSVRLIVDELCGVQGLQVREEGLEAISLLAELPDLWDIVIGTWADDSTTSRFAGENAREPFHIGIKALTSKPVVGVGRFTSPDTMVSLIRRGVLDMIGATRPSIADPFLPKKIEQGRFEDIRECIGCNICVSSHYLMTNLRCTQNPTAGEEWRKGWHPEKIQPRRSEQAILIVGAGPSGLECARALGQRGYEVTLVDRERSLGGRVTREGALPGLAEWLRVRDWRVTQLRQLTNVSIYLDSAMTADTVLEFGAPHVVIATGSRWRSDGVGRLQVSPLVLPPTMTVLSPDDIMSGTLPGGDVLVYDDDHYYMGNLVAETLARSGARVTLVTSGSEVSSFGLNTLEVPRVARRMHELGVEIITHHVLSTVDGEAVLQHVHTGQEQRRALNALVLVTARLPNDELYDALLAQSSVWPEKGLTSLNRIGDCYAPGAIFHAVYSGHRFAREFQEEVMEVPFRRERLALGAAVPR